MKILEYSHLVESLGEEAIAVECGRGMGPVVQTFTGGGFESVQRNEFDHFHRMDQAGFIGYARSASYLPRQGPEYERMRAALETMYARTRIPMATWSFRTGPRSFGEIACENRIARSGSDPHDLGEWAFHADSLT